MMISLILSRNNSTVIALWLGCLFSIVKFAATSDPVFDPSTTMRLVLVPADALVGSVIFRLRASDDEFDYPLTFELVGDSSSSTVQIDSLPCTKYNSVCQANVVLRRRLEPGRYYDFQVSVKDTKGGMAQQGCSITATNFTTPTDLIFPKRTSIIMVSEVMQSDHTSLLIKHIKAVSLSLDWSRHACTIYLCDNEWQ